MEFKEKLALLITAGDIDSRNLARAIIDYADIETLLKTEKEFIGIQLFNPIEFPACLEDDYPDLVNKLIEKCEKNRKRKIGREK